MTRPGATMADKPTPTTTAEMAELLKARGHFTTAEVSLGVTTTLAVRCRVKDDHGATEVAEVVQLLTDHGFQLDEVRNTNQGTALVVAKHETDD